MQQLSLQLRNTLLMVNKTLLNFSHTPLWLIWSIKGLPLFFCALLVPKTNIFTPPAHYFAVTHIGAAWPTDVSQLHRRLQAPGAPREIL